jgi:hypothetical protein
MCHIAPTEQLLLFVEAIPDEDGIEALPVVRRIVDALGVPPPVTCAPRSVFDLAARPVSVQLGRIEPEELRMVARVVVQDGVTRTVGAAYPARWTPEDEERERQRRARQRPPKPTKKARTRSRKLMEMIGGGD